jgi:hypothetical protein
MTDEAIAQPGEGGESLPEVKAPAAKSDLEGGTETDTVSADSPASEKQEPDKPEPDKADEKAERQRNRTKAYIDRLNAENAELRRAKAELDALRAPKAAAPVADDGKPNLAQFDYDIEKFTEAKAAWEVERILKSRDEATQKQAAQSQQQEILQAYQERLEAFADDHPDFQEVVGSIQYPLADELQAAIMAHEKGAAIAYHLGLNDDDAFQLASVQPHLAAAAVDRLAKRLAAPAPVAAPAATRPVTKAPAPPPSLTGKSPVSVPPEKLTDEEWLAREKERARKR